MVPPGTTDLGWSPPTGWPLHLVGITVNDLAGALEPWTLLGFAVVAEGEVGSQGVQVRMLSAGATRREFLAPLFETSPVARFLAKRGPGLHHVAFRLGDLAGELGRLQTAGAHLIDDEPRPGFGGHAVAFVHPTSSNGVLVELVQAP